MTKYIILDIYNDNKKKEFIDGVEHITDKEKYFEYLQIKISELIKVRNLVNGFSDNNKENLLEQLDTAITSLNLLKNDVDSYKIFVEVDLEIKITNNYSSVMYYMIDNEGLINESPSILILENNLNYIYFGHELFSIINDDDFFDLSITDNIGYQSLYLYAIDYNNKKIYQTSEDRKDYTYNLYDHSRYDMRSLVYKLFPNKNT